LPAFASMPYVFVCHLCWSKTKITIIPLRDIIYGGLQQAHVTKNDFLHGTPLHWSSLTPVIFWHSGT
jgi:hypothetical protein